MPFIVAYTSSKGRRYVFSENAWGIAGTSRRLFAKEFRVRASADRVAESLRRTGFTGVRIEERTTLAQEDR